MQYQLVLQFSGDTLAEYDEMIALEDELIEVLGNAANVDGHDCGSGERNIFIFTSDPALTFSMLKGTLKARECLDSVVAAFRLVSGENYKVIWPQNSTLPFSIG